MRHMHIAGSPLNKQGHKLYAVYKMRRNKPIAWELNYVAMLYVCILHRWASSVSKAVWEWDHGYSSGSGRVDSKLYKNKKLNNNSTPPAFIKNFVLLGDFNIDLLQPDSSPAIELTILPPLDSSDHYSIQTTLNFSPSLYKASVMKCLPVLQSQLWGNQLWLGTCYFIPRSPGGC